MCECRFLEAGVTHELEVHSSHSFERQCIRPHLVRSCSTSDVPGLRVAEYFLPPY